MNDDSTVLEQLIWALPPIIHTRRGHVWMDEAGLSSLPGGSTISMK